MVPVAPAVVPGPDVTPGTRSGGVSLMPRANGLSLICARPVVLPAAAFGATVACTAAAGLICCVLVPSAVLEETRPFIGVLPASGQAAAIRSQIVAGGTPLPPGASYTAGASAAAGGTAPPSARELALQQLAGIGIINPSEDQIRTAIIGGTLTTVNGVVQLPGVLAR